MNESNKSSAVTTAVVVGVLGLVVGFGGAKLATHKTTTAAATPTSATKSADLRSNLVTLGVEHMDLSDLAIDQALDGAPGAAAAKADLINNGHEIGAAIGSVYGTAAQTSFDKIWDNHLTDFVNYAVADKTGDATAKAAAVADLTNNYIPSLATLLSGANPNLPKATVEQLLSDHVTGTAQMVDAHVSGNYTQEAQLREAGANHMEGIMSDIAGAIVKQNPSKF